MNDVLRIARLKIALQRAFLGRAILRVITLSTVSTVSTVSAVTTVSAAYRRVLPPTLMVFSLFDVVKKVVEGQVGNLRYFSLPRLRQIVTQWNLKIVGLLHI